MMRKKIVSFMLCIACLFGVVGCNPKGPDAIPNAIYISLYSGGYGTEWMTSWLKEYNEKNTDYTFVKLQDNREENNTIMAKIMRVPDADIYIQPSSDIWELKNGGYLMDLSSIYDSAAENEEKLIKDKVHNYDLLKSVYGVGDSIYALPYTTSPVGFIYDHDLFVEQGFLIKDGDSLSLGKDGIAGTYDDGLPVTTTEFKELLNKIKEKQYYPFIFSNSGQFHPRGKALAENIWAGYEGVENYKLSYTFEGTYTAKNGDQTVLTGDNGYLFYQDQAFKEGRLKGLDFLLENYLDTSNIHPDYLRVDADESMGRFILSHNKADRIAMIIDGYWWENESKMHFLADEKKNNNPELGFKKRDFRYLPMPMYEGSYSIVNKENYLISAGEGSVIALKTNDENKEKAIKKFLTEYCSDVRLQNFTLKSGAVLPFDYEIDREQAKTLSPYSQNMIEVLQSSTLLTPELYEIASEYGKYNQDPVKRWTLTVGKQSSAAVTSIGKSIKDGVYTYQNYLEALSQTYNVTNWPTKG